MNPRKLSVTTPLGLTLDGAEGGDPRGAPLIFLHGATDSWRSFLPLLAHVPDRYRTIAFSYRGHGDSAEPEAAYRIEDHADDLAAALSALGITRAAIVGHSLGTLVAQQFAASWPERASALVLIGIFVNPSRNPVIAELCRDTFSSLEDPLDPAFVRSWQEGTSSPAVDPAFLSGVVVESLKVPARVWRDTFHALLDTDLSDRLRALIMPTLVLSGAFDEMCHDEEDLFAASVRNVTRKRFGWAGHAPHWEDPASVAAEMVPFLDAVERGEAPAPHNRVPARAAAQQIGRPAGTEQPGQPELVTSAAHREPSQ
ncbi:Tropinesterase [Defluviimonas aquaemixtae]|uniref:Tropinesterase n=1 Tax=Albidovulum aquaemixtae TaxID=1542388 RepID=A0A2R8BMJ3_9RHOB|nr:alpha/beta hydrolase [Defluviimonas aquaemixtae]SPH24648.1 Tropinesterase [Defluviimonas aquaemixtae]